MRALTATPEKLEDFGEIVLPEQSVQPILGESVRAVLLDWLEENWAEAELAEVGVQPRRRILVDGPPGVGKTTLAHHLAARLGLPMLDVQAERMFSAYHGETSQNIGRLFRLAANKVRLRGGGDPVPLVLFLDEFDGISRQRRGAASGADDARNQEVNTLLARLESFPGYVIAATNFGETVDQAVWRRFDIHLTLTLPGPRERALILAMYLAPFGLPGRVLEAFAESFEGASPSLIRGFCEDLKRQLVIGVKLGRDMSRGAVMGRILVGRQPPPELGKPRLWSLGLADPGLLALPWPLPMADDVADEAQPAIPDGATVVPFGPRP